MLAQQYHPDRNAGDLESARIMSLLNEAYRVLSDPDLRREHDAWIERQEKTSPAEHQSNGAYGNVDRSDWPASGEKAEDPLRSEDPKTQLTNLDQEYAIFKRKLPYYLMNGAALAALMLIIWALGR